MVEAARYIGCPCPAGRAPNSIYEIAQEIGAKINGRWLIHRDALDQYVLMQAYPNPFNPEATVRFALRDSAPVTLTLHDALGRQVSTLYSGTPAANQTLSVRIDGSGLPSGLYIRAAFGGRFYGCAAGNLTQIAVRRDNLPAGRISTGWRPRRVASCGL